jgi:hypothetical protein
VVASLWRVLWYLVEDGGWCVAADDLVPYADLARLNLAVMDKHGGTSGAGESRS